MDPDRLVAPHIHQAASAADGSTVVQVAGDYRVGNWLVSSLEISQEEIDQARGCFAEPEGFAEARAVLQRHSFVVICGKEHTGRRLAGLRLLDEVASNGIQELVTDWPAPRISLLPAIDRPCLLDLSAEADVIPEGFGRQLANLVGPMYRTGGCLVVIVTPSVWRKCAAETEKFTVDLKRPDAVEVVRAHLRSLDTGGGRLAWLNVPPLSIFMDDLKQGHVSPRDAVAIAKRISEIDKITPEIVQDLRRQLHHWKDYLDQKLGDLNARGPDRYLVARRRAVLVAAAVLDGSSAEAVLSSSDVLLSKVGVKVPPEEFLVGPEVSGLLEDIEAGHRGTGVSIVKVKPGIDDAVLGRVWRERPQLREYLLDWLAEIAAARSQPGATLERVVEVLARLAEHQRAFAVLEIIQSWLPASAGVTKHRLAVEVLERLAVSREIGSAVRRRLREWATQRRVDDGVLIGIAEVCGGKLGEYSADVALNRLQLIAQSRRGDEVDQAVVHAIRAVVDRGENHRIVTDHILRWSFEEGTRAAGLLGLWALIGADSAEVGPSVDRLRVAEFPILSQALISAWSVLLASGDTRDSALGIAEIWLRQADHDVADRRLVVSILGPAFRTVAGVALEISTFLFAADRQSKTREELGAWLLRVGGVRSDQEVSRDEDATRL